MIHVLVRQKTVHNVLATIHRRMGTARIALLVIVAIALGLRLIGLGERAFWGDELFALRAARKPLLDLFLPQMIDNGTQIGFYAVAHVWVSVFPAVAAPIEATALRILPLLFSVATIPVVAAIAAHVGSRLHLAGWYRAAAPLLAAALIALSPFAVRYAQEFRAYSLQLLLLSTATLLLLRAADGRAMRGWWIVYGLLAAMSVYVHMLSALFVAVQVGALFLLAIASRRYALASGLVGGSLLAAPLVAPLAITLLRFGSSPMSWVPSISFSGVFETLSSLFAVPPGFETATNLVGMANMPAGELPIERVPLLLIAMLPLLLGVRRLLHTRRESAVIMAILLLPLLLVPLIFAVSSLVAAKIWWTRYLHMLLLPIIPLSAIGLLEAVRLIQSRWEGGRALSAYLAAFLLVVSGMINATGLVSVLDRRAGPDWNISHRAALEEAKARWDALTIRNYTFTLTLRCYCDTAISGPFTVRVAGEQIVVRRDGMAVAERIFAGQRPTAEALFAFIAERLDALTAVGAESGPDKLRITYDRATGLPTRVWTGAVPGAPRETALGFNLDAVDIVER